VCSFIVALAILCFLCGPSGEAARCAADAGGMIAVSIHAAKRGAESKVTKPLSGRAGLPKAAAIVTYTNVNPLAVSSCTVWCKKLLSLITFFAAAKKVNPPAGEAVTE
jgi:hypothetical protein